MDSPSDDEQDANDLGIPGPSGRFYGEEEMDVDDTLCTLLASLHLEHSRNKKPTEQDDDMLRRVHERMQATIQNEIDDARRRRLKKALQPSNCIREQIFYLRRTPSNVSPAPSYFPRLSTALSTIVNESFEEEYRKVAVLLGLVEALAEVLVLEVIVFGSLPRAPEHRSVRKLIANALTNLTFGHVISKRRLCAYSDFLPTVIRIINDARNLAQVYAGLIRNLSWLADSEMSSVLSPCVRALCRAAIHARQSGDEGCVRATLSAVWNLASHSIDNKRVICDEPGCLRMLASLLTPNTSHTVIVESASGILKYASQYLATTSSHLEERTMLATGLVQLLTSASFTISCNALSALANLIAKDPHLQVLIRSNGMAMHQLNSLLDSARDDIRTAVKNVLNHLNQPSGYMPRYNEMSSSMGVGFEGNRESGRLLPLRAVRGSPGAVHAFSTLQHRSSSLPRHFARGGFVGANHLNHLSPAPQPAVSGFRTQEQEVSTFGDDKRDMGPAASFDDGIGDEEDDVEAASASCNRSNASRLSLESEMQNQSGWNSVLDTANNSNRLSPVSPSELPDSPTHYTLLKHQQELNRAVSEDTSKPLSITVRGNGQSELSTGQGSRLTSSDATTAIVEDQATPSFNLDLASCRRDDGRDAESESSDEALPGPSMEGELEYAVLEKDNDLLQRSIEAALPPPSPKWPSKAVPIASGTDSLLDNVIQSALPSPCKLDNAQSSDRLLMECIMSAMPGTQSNSHGVSPKNEQGGRVTSVISSIRHQTIDHPNVATSHITDDSETACEDDCFEHEICELDTSLPMDCLEEEMTIDCSAVSISEHTRRRRSRSGIPQPTKLPTPKSRISHSKNGRPQLMVQRLQSPVKPMTHAIVSPYNYKKPEECVKAVATSPDAKNSNSTMHANTMLVTTV